MKGKIIQAASIHYFVKYSALLLFFILGNAAFPHDHPPVPNITFNPANGATGVSVSNNLTIVFDVAVRNLDNSAITNGNVSGLITLKLTNSGGAAVAFSASINGGKTAITISPSSNLASSQLYYLAL